MNIQSVLKKIFIILKDSQITEKDLTPENFGVAAYRAGMLDSANLLIKIANGELSDEQVDIEITRLKDSIKESNQK